MPPIILQKSISPDDQWNYRINLGNERGKIKCIHVKNSGITLDLICKHNNRMLKTYDINKFATVNFSDFRLKEKPMSETSDYIERFLTDGITINSTTYHFFGCSNSQLRTKTCYLYADKFPKIDRMINSMGDFANINSIAKKMKRIGLLFTSTNEGIELRPHEYEDIDDIEAPNGDVFTDGCGFISKDFATYIAKTMKITFRNRKYIPSVFQIRFKGYKGVVMQNIDLKGQCKVQLRKSMKKFKGCDDNNFSAKNHSMAYTFGNLNAELITLLSALGIKDEIFLKKQKEHFEFIKESVKSIEFAFEFCCYKNQILLAERILNEGLGVPDIQKQLGKLQSEEIKTINKLSDFERKRKVKIFIPESRLLFGVCDSSGKLKENEVFVRITTEGDMKKTIEGAEIIVSRNPCLHPGDIQKFKAVDVPELRYLHDVIVFPTVGTRPAASLLSGGDLDGDRFFVCWDKELIPETLFEPYGYPPAKVNIQNEITHTDLVRYFVRWNNSSLGKIKNLYLDWCRSSTDGAASRECQELNVLFSSAVDAEKVQIPDHLLNPPPNPNKSFIIDILWRNSKREIFSTIQCEPELISLNPRDTIEFLVTSDIDILSEFDIYKMVQDICIRNDIDIREYLCNFDFDAFTDMEKRWATQMLRDVDYGGDLMKLVLNSLSRSQILDRDELKNHPLHTANNKIINWKLYYSNTEDDGRRFGIQLAQCMREFKRKLIVIGVNDLLKIAIYIPITLDCSIEENFVVDDAIKVFPFTQLKNLNVPTNTVAGYKLEFNERIFQLYLKEKQNNTFVFFQNVNGQIKMSIATQKFNQDIQRHVGRIRRETSESVEIYVISHCDAVGHQLLDISMNEVVTTRIRPCVENIPKEFEMPKLSNVDFKQYPDIYRRILIDRKFSLLKGLDEAKNFMEIFELCYENNAKHILALIIDYVLENWKEIKIFYEVLQLILGMIRRLPFVAIEVSQYLGKEAICDLGEDECRILLKGIINCCNELPSLCQNQIRLALIILRDKSIRFSWNFVVDDLIQTIIFGIRRKSVAIEYLKLILNDFADLILNCDLHCIEYFRKFVFAVCVDYLSEVNDQTEIDAKSNPICKKNDILLQNIRPTSDVGIYSAEIRLDCQYTIKINDHVRFVCALPEGKDDNPIAFDAIIQSMKKGSFTFKIQQETPSILLLASWKLIICSTTTTLMAELDAILKLMTIKQNSTLIYPVIIGNDDDMHLDLVCNSQMEFRNDRLNDSQKEAVINALSNPLTLVWGPPGAGKTTVVVETILQLNRAFQNEQILICASTHNAVDNILEKFLTVVDINEENFDKQQVIRVATEVSKVKSLLRNWTVDAFVGCNPQDNFKAKREAEKKVKNAKFIFTTCTGAGLGFLRQLNYKIVIVDEASQLTEPNCLVPLVKGSKKIIMVGDHVQLRPNVSVDAQEYHLQLSLFERLYNSDCAGIAKTMLNVQYRMNPLLAKIASEISYDGQLMSGVSEERRQPQPSKFPWPEMIDGKIFPAVFVNCGTDEDLLFSKSKSNLGQAKVVVEIVKKLRFTGERSGGIFSIVVLSPYNEQVKLVKRKLGSVYPGVEVNTIDGFQGREADFVILTTVRKNDRYDLGFSDDPRRINVAITRAKFGLVVVGHRGMLESSVVWKGYLEKMRDVDFRN